MPFFLLHYPLLLIKSRPRCNYKRGYTYFSACITVYFTCTANILPIYQSSNLYSRCEHWACTQTFISLPTVGHTTSHTNKRAHVVYINKIVYMDIVKWFWRKHASPHPSVNRFHTRTYIFLKKIELKSSFLFQESPCFRQRDEQYRKQSLEKNRCHPNAHLCTHTYTYLLIPCPLLNKHILLWKHLQMDHIGLNVVYH